MESKNERGLKEMEKRFSLYDVKEVKSTKKVAEANQLLHEGWRIIHAATSNGKPHFLLGITTRWDVSQDEQQG
jgi:hypothetical protein